MNQYLIETQNSDGSWKAAFGMAPRKPVTDPGFEPALRSYLRANFPAHLNRPIRVVNEAQTVLLTLEG